MTASVKVVKFLHCNNHPAREENQEDFGNDRWKPTSRMEW